MKAMSGVVAGCQGGINLGDVIRFGDLGDFEGDVGELLLETLLELGQETLFALEDPQVEGHLFAAGRSGLRGGGCRPLGGGSGRLPGRTR